MLQTALEAEVTEYLQRQKYERHPEERGYRNGYFPERSITLGSGSVSVKVPRVRQEPEGQETFQSELIRPYQKRSETFSELLLNINIIIIYSILLIYYPGV